MSQSPQTGQFNSYNLWINLGYGIELIVSQSPQTGQFNSYLILGFREKDGELGLNPLKRVNSILTKMCNVVHLVRIDPVSIPSNGSIQFLQRRFQVTVEQGVGRSKKTVIVKRWLRGWGVFFLTLFN